MRIRFISIGFAPLLLMTLLAVPAVAQDWGDKMIERRQIHFGQVARFTETTFNVTVKNPFLEEIRITNLTTSCGCISWTEQVPISIPSKAERELTIRLDTVRHSGEKHVKAFITLNEPSKKLTNTVTLSVEGRIRNDLEIEPSSVVFGSVEVGLRDSRTLRMTYTGHPGWKLLSAHVGSDHYATQILETSRIGGNVHYDVIVELKPDAPIGLVRGRLILMTNEADHAEIAIPIEAKIEPDILVTDAQFGIVTVGHPKSVTVVMRSKKPIRIESVDQVNQARTAALESSLCDLTKDVDQPDVHTTVAGTSFKTQFSTNLNPMHSMTITVISNEESGMFEESFAAKISGRDQPITFKAFGRTMAQR